VSKERYEQEEFFKTLTALEDVLDDNTERARLIKKRIARLRRFRGKGMSYGELVANEGGPLIVQLLTESSSALDTCGASVRRAEARALYDEGLTMEQIAEAFGVTRQRVSALLRQDS
jgi:Sigma-70, region 4